MLADILRENGIEDFASVHASRLFPANRRLYDGLPQDCTAVFVLFPYYRADKNEYLAAFAAVPDYHTLAERLFGKMSDYVRERYGVFARGYADHSPFDERRGAAAAGLGVLGRNGLLISHRHSSFVCIGELVCALDAKALLAEGIPEGDGEIRLCEDCGRCIDACPRGCAGGSDKGERCLSAVTQKKGELTAEEARAVRDGGSVWGCDICQTVCPHTRAAERDGTLETSLEFFGENVLSGGLDELEALGDAEFSRYPFSFRRRSVLARNIEIMRGDGND